MSLLMLCCFRLICVILHRAHFPGGAMSYTEYHGYVSRQAAGLPG